MCWFTIYSKVTKKMYRQEGKTVRVREAYMLHKHQEELVVRSSSTRARKLFLSRVSVFVANKPL